MTQVLDQATERASAAVDAAVAKLAEARDKYTAVQQRIADATAADAETPGDQLEALATELDAAGTELEDASDEHERAAANLVTAEKRSRLVRDAATHARHATPRDPSRRVELTYHKGNAHERSFFQDAWAAKLGDSEANERVHRNTREMRDMLRDTPQARDVDSAAFAGLVVPNYLTELVAPLARAGRPFLNTVRKLELPKTGTTVVVSRITTGSAVAWQATETATPQETDMDDTVLTINIRQLAGQQDIARVAFERAVGLDELVYQDLAMAYMTGLNAGCLNGAGTSGTPLGVRSTAGIVAVTYTDASPTVPEAYPKLADAIQQIASGRFLPATTVLMHPRRWGWATAALDSQNRPLVVPNGNGPFNAIGVGDAPEYGQVVGSVHGLPVVTDASIPTNLGGGTEDVIIVYRAIEDLLWEAGDGMPRRFTFEEPIGPQMIRLAVWGESAFTAGRYPAANATIGGTGLAAPTF